MNLPMVEALYLAPKLSRPDSESLSLEVKCMGLGSAPEQVSHAGGSQLGHALPVSIVHVAGGARGGAVAGRAVHLRNAILGVVGVAVRAVAGRVACDVVGHSAA